MLRCVLIDVGGTLWPDQWPNSTERLYLRRLGEELDLAEPAVRQLLLELKKRDPALISPSPLEQDTLGLASAALVACGLSNVAPMRLIELMSVPAPAGIDLFPGAVEFLEALKSLRLRTVVFSNATFRTSASYRRDFEMFSVSHLVDDIISSVDIGFRKPSDQIFAAALEAAGCAPSGCAMVGDSEERDIVPAIARGMRAIRVAIEQPAEDETAADATATCLDEVVAVIRNWTEGLAIHRSLGNSLR